MDSRGFAWISKKQCWREETMGDFFWKFGEMVCVDFQKGMLAGGSYGGLFPEIWRGFAWISKKQCWREETMREFFQKFGEGWRGFPKSNVGGRKQKAILA